MPLFGKILGTFYNEDIVDEDDIQKWHLLPASRGVGMPDGLEAENVRKCWAIGKAMLASLAAQDSEDESGEDDDNEDEDD